VKVSSVAPEHRAVLAPALVFESQQEFLAAFGRGELERDHVAVVRGQGPRANGMPELHKLTPALGVLQDRGHRVALVTDGRMSGASGKVAAFIHLTPEAAAGGPLALVRDGDLIAVDADRGTLDLVGVDLAERAGGGVGDTPGGQTYGTGRELFSAFRRLAGSADTGASIYDHAAPAREAAAV
jgi:phosphogluconate dehydratase